MKKQTNTNPAQTITFELPKGVTSRDVLNLLRIASKDAHAQRMEIARTENESPEQYQENEAKQNYLSHLFNAANRLTDQAHEIAWQAPDAVQTYYNTEKLFNH